MKRETCQYCAYVQVFGFRRFQNPSTKDAWENINMNGFQVSKPTETEYIRLGF